MALAERSIFVYCASSRACDAEYHDVARRLGEILAGAGCSVVYGGGRAGSMGALAEGALAEGGHIVGVIPKFMVDLEWGHDDLSELHVVEDMRTRKHEMLTRASAVVALAGGTGTLEELFEAITLKRLGLFLGPIVIVNTKRLLRFAHRAAPGRDRRAVHGRAPRVDVDGRAARPTTCCRPSSRRRRGARIAAISRSCADSDKITA